MNKQWHLFYKISGFAAFFQLAMIIIIGVSGGVFGSKPENILQYYSLANENFLKIIIVSDLPTLLILLPYYLTFLSLWNILKKENEPVVLLSVLFTFIAVSSIILLNHDFALIKLAGEYARSNNVVDKHILEAAGKALFVNDMWNSTAAYLGGIFLQGAGLMISFVILRSKQFNNRTAYTGIWGNGFDLIQHLIHIFIPDIAKFILMISGPGYLLWFIFLGKDLLKISKRTFEDRDKLTN